MLFANPAGLSLFFYFQTFFHFLAPASETVVPSAGNDPETVVIAALPASPDSIGETLSSPGFDHYHEPGDICDSIIWTGTADTCIIRDGDFRTQTMGGWGTSCSGNNPGCYRDANFADAFPDGLTIGCVGGHQLTFTNSAAVEAFLPCGSTGGPLTASTTDPSCIDNVLAGQLLAATLSVGFDAWDPDFGAEDFLSSELIFRSGVFAEFTVQQVINKANDVLGGCVTGSASDLIEALTDFNEAFVDGTGFTSVLKKPGCEQCCVLNLQGPGDTLFPCPVDEAALHPDLLGFPTLQIDVCADAEDGEVCEWDDSNANLDGIEWAWEDSSTGSCPEIIHRVFTATLLVSDNPDILYVTTSDIDIEWDTLEVHCHQNITIVDDGPPIIDSLLCPNDTVLYVDADCNVEFPQDTPFYVVSDCDPYPTVNLTGPVNEVVEQVSEGCYTVEQTWTVTATDWCELTSSATCSRTIHIEDNTPPTIVLTCPADETVYVDGDCYADLSGLAEATASFDDDCALGATSLTYSDQVTAFVSDGCYTITRTWTASASDECGNHAADATCTQTIHIEDNIDPVIDAADSTVLCIIDSGPDYGAWTSADWTAYFNPTASDNCDTDVEATFVSANPIAFGCTTHYEVHWHALDDCGNNATATSNLYIIDEDGPVVSTICPDTMDLYVDADCAFDVPLILPDWELEDCDPYPQVDSLYYFDFDTVYTGSTDDSSPEGCFTFTRRWITFASDLCENIGQDTCYHVFQVNDTIDPVIVAEPLVHIPCELWGDFSDSTMAYATDNCDSEVSLTCVSFNEVSGSCAGTYVKVFRAEDDCGNWTEFEQVIHLIDSIPPTVTITCPPDAMVSKNGDCVASADTAIYGAATATIEDNCDPNPYIVSIDFVDRDTVYAASADDDTPEGCFTFIREWTAIGMDHCDSTDTAVCEQLITVVDETDPTIVVSDTTLYCDSEVEADYEEWTAEDWFNLLDPSATDNCDSEVNLQINFPIQQTASGCTTTYAINWRAFDDCANSANSTSYLHVIDEEGPVVSTICPDTMDLYVDADCAFDVPLILPDWELEDCDPYPQVDSLYYFDFDTVYTGSTDDSSPEGCFTFTRRWITFASDLCENVGQDTCYHVFQVNDTIDPVITGDAVLTIDCGDWTMFEDSVLVSASDNCDSEVRLEIIDEDEVSGACPFSLFRTYRAWDDCGNSTDFQQYIHVTDTDPPTIDVVCPDDATLMSDADCNAPTDTAALGAPSFMVHDDCDPMPVIDTVYYHDSPAVFTGIADDANPEGCYTFTRTWTIVAEDWCTNKDSVHCQQNITVEDALPPVVEVLDVTIPCAEVDLYENMAADDFMDFAIADITDNCDSEVAWTLTREVSLNPSGCGGNLTATWIVSDDCLNIDTIVQTIPILVDGEPVFTLTCLGSETYWADANCDVDLSDIGVEYELDLPCIEGAQPEPSITYEENTIEYTGPHCFTVERTYTGMVHWCGDTLFSSCSHTYTVQDTIGPVISLTCEDLSLSCAGLENLPEAPPAFAVSDNCGVLDTVITFTDDLITPPVGDDASPQGCYVVERTWMVEATDECLNHSADSCVQVIEVYDVTPPYFVDAPDDMTLECGDEYDFMTPEAQDHCDTEVTVTCADETVVTYDDCPFPYSTTWTCTAVDDCMNETEASWTVNWIDETPPVCYDCPGDVTVCCPDEVPPPYDVSFGDNCLEEVAVTLDTVELWNPECPTQGQVLYIYTGTDCSGNVYTHTQTITIDNPLPPVFTSTCGLEDGEVVEVCCETLTEQMLMSYACNDITWDDDCPNELEVSFSDSLYFDGEEGGSCTVMDPEPMPGTDETCTGFTPHAMRLFNLPSNDKEFNLTEPGLVNYEGDTVWNYTATLHVAGSPDDGFDLVVQFGEGLDWNDWSTQDFPTGYKLDCPDLTDNHESWMYFILQSGTLTGFGAYEGSDFELFHQPQNQYFGCQVGDGANNANENYGFSTWFIIQGTYTHDGQAMDFFGSGDLFGDLECCPSGEYTASYTLTDCGCNTTMFSYSIVASAEACDLVAEQANGENAETQEVFTVGGSLDEELEDKFPITILGVSPNPTNHATQIQFETSAPVRVVIDLIQMDGSLVMEIFEGVIHPGFVYTQNLLLEDYENGMYQIRWVTEQGVITKKVLYMN